MVAGCRSLKETHNSQVYFGGSRCQDVSQLIRPPWSDGMTVFHFGEIFIKGKLEKASDGGYVMSLKEQNRHISTVKRKALAYKLS